MKNRIKVVVGILLSLLLLWFLFRDTNWGQVASAIRQAKWGWLVLGCLVLVASFFTRILRWKYIVHTAKPVSFKIMFNATQIGLLGNFVLPLRAGEAIRAVVLSRRSALPFSKSLAFVALDRVTDLFGLLVTMTIAVLFYRPVAGFELPEELGIPPEMLTPENIRNGALLLAVGLVGLSSCFVVLFINQRLAIVLVNKVVGVFSTRLAEWAAGILQHFADGLHIFRSPRDFSKALFFSLLTWGMFALSYECCFRAFSISPPWYGSFITLTLVAIMISVPSSPGFIGVFHLGVIASMHIICPEADLDVMDAVAIVAHMMNVVTIVLMGIYCLHQEQFGLFELRSESAADEEQKVEQ